MIRELPALPETEIELRYLSELLEGKESDLYLGERATEGHVKNQSLEQFKYIGFATHALTAGEFDGFSEPAIILTPPPQGTTKMMER